MSLKTASRITKRTILLFLIAIYTCFQSQAQSIDIKQAREYAKKGDDFYKLSQFDSSNYFYQKAADVFGKLALKNNDTTLLEKKFQYLYFKGWNISLSGKNQDAIDYLFPLLDQAINALGDQNLQVANLYNGLGNSYRNIDKKDSALIFYKKAIGINRVLYGENNYRVAMAQSNIGVVYNDLGEFDSAINNFEQALKVYFESDNADRLASHIANAYNNMGHSYREGKDNNHVALEYFRKSLPYRLKVFGKEGVPVAQTYRNIAISSMHIREYDTAMVYHQKSLEIRLKKLGAQHPVTALHFIDFGLLHMHLENIDSALHYYHLGIEVLKEELGENHSTIGTAYNNIALAFEHKTMTLPHIITIKH